MMGVEEEEERPLFHGVPLFCFFSTIGTQRGLGESIEGYEASASTARSTNRSGTIVPRSADNETPLRGQLTLLLLLRRWFVLAFIVSLIVLVGALFFASGEAYGKDGGDSTTSGGSGGGGGDSTTSGGSGGGKGGSGGGGGDS